MGKVIATRDLIISKAMSIFNTKGYRATSLSDITKATGITKGAIYGNFPNKDAVAVASFDFAVEKVLEQLRERIKSATTAPLKLKAIVRYYEEYVFNPPISGGCPVINTSIESDDDHPMLRARVVRTIAIVIESLQKIVYRGINEGQIKKETKVDEFVRSFYAAIQGAIVLSRVEGDLASYQLVRKHIEKQIDSITS
jgi:AcrR family transcriptional regulator